MGVSLGYVPLSPHLTLMPASAGTTIINSGFLRQNNCTELKHSLRAVSTIVYKHKCLSVGRKYTRRNRFLSPEAQHKSTRIAEPLTASANVFPVDKSRAAGAIIPALLSVSANAAKITLLATTVCCAPSALLRNFVAKASYCQRTIDQ